MAKNIVVCLDGTWNKPEKLNGRSAPTNVLKLMRALTPTGENGRCQVVFYDRGVGTGGITDKITGGVFGVGLSENVQDGYRFIANNYDPGDDSRDPDDIYLFGFSRGAFTARSLAGMIGAVGLLEKRHMHRLPQAYAIYRTKPEERPKHPDYGLVDETRKVRIKFIGVWDTVGALGIPVTWLKWIGQRRHKFHNVELGANVEHAYQALAIDEHRKPFEAALWKRPQTPPAHQQVVEQVWFAGAHANVGGGYQDAGLSDLALEWMIEKAEVCGLRFDSRYRADMIHGRFDGQLVDSRRWHYRVWRPFHRVAREPSHFFEGIHPSVLERLEHPPSKYAPKNDFLEQVFGEMREVGREVREAATPPPAAVALRVRSRELEDA